MSEALEISLSNAEKLCRSLLTLGLIKGTKGRTGGYVLTDEITRLGLSDLYEVVYPGKPITVRIPITLVDALRLMN